MTSRGHIGYWKSAAIEDSSTEHLAPRSGLVSQLRCRHCGEMFKTCDCGAMTEHCYHCGYGLFESIGGTPMGNLNRSWKEGDPEELRDTLPSPPPADDCGDRTPDDGCYGCGGSGIEFWTAISPCRHCGRNGE